MIEATHAWVNGAMVPLAEARTHLTAFTLHYGLAVFEGVRCYRRDDGRSAVFRLREHIDRLFDSARIATLDIPFSRADLIEACLATLRANAFDEAYLRPLVFIGPGSLGLGTRDNPVETAIVSFRWAPPLGEEGQRSGVRALVSSLVRGHPNHAMSKAKISGGYVNSVLAKREAQRLGAEEAILLDTEGRVAEGTADNIFIVHQGTLLTPPLDMPILAGITRASVLTLAREANLGVEIVERSFTRDMLYTASEIFLTGTAIELTPVREVDGRAVGDGRPGPITRALQSAFTAATRSAAPPHPDWLTWL
jgi:branched-chain amino acid aminotransferase